MDENGEVIFRIPSEASKKLKPGAFYNFAILVDAFDKTKKTEYKKLTENGNIIIEYGAQDLEVLLPELEDRVPGEIVSARLEEVVD
jgi:hypothetical protein